MRKIFPYLIFVLSFYSCRLLDPCSFLKCGGSNYSLQLRIVNDSDGKDLIFGSAAIYDEKNIQFFSLEGVDTSYFEFTSIKFPDTGYDSILVVRFYPQTNLPVYLKLSDSDIDTLTLNYQTLSSKCCGKFTEIKDFRYNNSGDIPGNEGTKSLSKKF